MIIYETTAALGYNQKAYLLRLDESNNGYNYLCIGVENIYDSDIYSIGEVVYDLEDFYVDEAVCYVIQKSPLYNTFLFDFFIKKYTK